MLLIDMSMIGDPVSMELALALEMSKVLAIEMIEDAPHYPLMLLLMVMYLRALLKKTW